MERWVLIVVLFQAEDGMRDIGVTGVQTCALPISQASGSPPRDQLPAPPLEVVGKRPEGIGRASCRERGEVSVVAGSLKKKKNKKTTDAPLTTTCAHYKIPRRPDNDPR